MYQFVTDNKDVPYNDFLNKLRDECSYHSELDQVNYRYKMACLALRFAENVESNFVVKDFVNVTTEVKNELAKQFRHMNREGLTDVAETLRVVAKHLHVKANLCQELNDYADKKLKELGFTR